MEFTDLLTIAIPCYERKEYFLDALNSALNQTIKCEIIVVDNCSSHNYFEQICNEKNIKYYRNETNIGLYPNQNRCYSLAETEYVKILDDDDLLMPEYVESFLRAIELHPEIDVFYSNYKLFPFNDHESDFYSLPYGYVGQGMNIIEFGVKYGIGFPYMTSTIKKTIAQLDLDINDCIGGYDWEWLYSNADKLSFYGDPNKIHYYRIHNNMASGNKIDWIANQLTGSYIYENILPGKIADPKLLRMISNKVIWELVLLKSYADKEELTKIIESENRYGRFLKTKLTRHIFLRTLFMMPKGLVRIIFRLLRKMRIAG